MCVLGEQGGADPYGIVAITERMHRRPSAPASYHHTYALALYRHGQAGKAAEVLRSLPAEPPHEFTYANHLLLLLALHQSGDRSAALELEAVGRGKIRKPSPASREPLHKLLEIEWEAAKRGGSPAAS
jgi:hypothetical protein